MSPMSAAVSRGAGFIGGVRGYPSELLHGEVACIAYHFHWSLTEIIDLDHASRRRWVAEIGRLTP